MILASSILDASGRAGLVIGYGAISTRKIEEGVRRLAVAFHRQRGNRYQ
jgi:DNA-binding transcriptional MocR family regulator